MVTVAEEPEVEEAHRLEDTKEWLTDAVRYVTTGSQTQNIRRPILFAIVGASLALGFVPLGFVALLLLALGDYVG